MFRTVVKTKHFTWIRPNWIDKRKVILLFELSVGHYVI